jgi:N-acetylmuramic acid 6-phosphate (MurNAc-6-P) etherase
MCVSVKLPFEAIKVLCGVDDNFLSFFTEMSLKWCLNAVSTGAHIAKGKILSNKMIDVQVSNTKLYYRAIRIIQDFCHVEKEIAESHLLNSIYNDKIPKSCDIGILHHIKTSTKQPLVVPTAILMVKSKISCTEARDWLSQQPVLRKALKMI